jgi:SAM-dependent methyltransferase
MKNQIPRLDSILEIGCGPENRWSRGTDGIDLIDFGQKYVGDFITYDFPKKYDAIICHHVLEHQDKPIEFMNKICDVLNDGGIVDIRVPTWPTMYSFIDPTHKLFIVFPEMFYYFTDKSPAGHCYTKRVFKVRKEERDRYEWEGHIILEMLSENKHGYKE